jgi:hypothetical protein
MAEGIQHLQESLERLAIRRHEVLTSDLVSELTVSLAKQNARTEAMALIDRSIAAVVKTNKPLHLPAYFLAKGSAFASGDAPDGLLAEEFFAKAMMQARQESAVPFELRAALELARIWIGRGEVQRTHDLISPVYRRFSEGLATPDLILARQILEQTGVRARQPSGGCRDHRQSESMNGRLPEWQIAETQAVNGGGKWVTQPDGVLRLGACRHGLGRQWQLSSARQEAGSACKMA